MRIFLLTIDEPVYTPKVIDTLLQNIPGKIVGAAFPKGFLSAKRIITSLLLFGPLHFAQLSFQNLINLRGGGTVHRLLRHNNVPILGIRSANDAAFIKYLRDQRIDVILSPNCPELLCREVLSVPNKGAINLHFGMLPAYRGIFPILHAIIRGEKQFGVTVHYMDEEFDNGVIINQSEISIEPGEGLLDLYPKAYKLGAQQLSRALLAIEAGNVSTFSNGPEGASYYSFPTLREITAYWRHVLKPRN